MSVRWASVLCLIVACGLPSASPLPPLAKGTVYPVRIATAFKGTFRCSGVEVHNNWALTAAHCADDDMWVDDKPVQLSLTPNPEWDMTIMQVPGLRGPDVVWTDHQPELGETSMLIGWGCSSNHQLAVAKTGHVESVDGRDLTYDVTVCPGDSGGPVYDAKERLIGLIVRMVESNHHAVVQYLGE